MSGGRFQHLAVSLVALFLGVTSAVAMGGGRPGPGKNGKELFARHCSGCHPDGGNSIHPQKTLHRRDREANGVRSVRDMVRLMRKPGPGMRAFGEDELSRSDAEAIAAYVLATFN